MKIFIINAHWNNHGDEAAIRAMIDGIREKYPEAEISIQFIIDQIKEFPYKKSQVKLISSFPRKKHLLELPFILLTKGRACFSSEAKSFCREVIKADMIIHAPGGPSIGDIYSKGEFPYLFRLLYTVINKKLLFFYAPSMGPFNNKRRNMLRKYILNRASCIVLREEISGEYVRKLNIRPDVVVTLDSAIQNNINVNQQAEVLQRDTDLYRFISGKEKVIGITITDLQWNPQYAGNIILAEKIRKIFVELIALILKKNYRVLFLPQLFGLEDDHSYMSRYITDERCFILNKCYDCNFQQYIISKLYSIIGMRYHSNIFAAKMATPFISISYEQKMQGFMEKIDMMEYCISIQELEIKKILALLEKLEQNYNIIKDNLREVNERLFRESKQTSGLLFKIIEKNRINT